MTWGCEFGIDQKLGHTDERELCGRGPRVSQWRSKRAPGDGSDDGVDEWEESSYDQVRTRTPRFGNDQRRDLCRDTGPSKAGKDAIWVCQIRATYGGGPVRAVISISLSSDSELKMN